MMEVDIQGHDDPVLPPGGFPFFILPMHSNRNHFLDPPADFLCSLVMPRTARIVLPGTPHHVTHSGNRRADLFLNDSDREVYRIF